MNRPSSPELEVVGVFNPAVIRHGREVVLLLRVAEALRQHSSGDVAVPVYNPESGRLEIKRWPGDTPGLDVSDSRMVLVDGRTWLTSISHLRVARSSDGIHCGDSMAALSDEPRHHV